MKGPLLIFLLFVSGASSGQYALLDSVIAVSCKDALDSLDGIPVLSIVDEMPEFVGGDEARIKFLSANIRYPEMTLSEGVQFSVYISFIIDTLGDVRNVCVLRPQSNDGFTGLEKECMRVVASMPRWVPGRHQGRKVPVRMNLPIKFEYDD